MSNNASIKTPQSAIRNPKSILIIDDSEDDILLTKMVLAKISREIRVDTALSGDAGLSFLRGATTPPSLIFLDLKMPKLDGFDVLREIRNDTRLRGIPVVIVTHSDLESDKEASFKAGANSFLNKSVDLDIFAKNIRIELEKWAGPSKKQGLREED